ncbi:MAG: translation initiation factor IF-5A [Candidatus Heimdallarchaeota archaeon]|nr:translation initiation factor IF-5A [Candidatus Heimdallarchaeota archaeon]RLI68062.1 MAG: translation initiation factor IF-5A [Candidatus Gerdarchaeota archaeon]RLI68747.1 MAG: translation initiation factor IF-5A [Candidatus Gerdarchaeota archaeon]
MSTRPADANSIKRGSYILVDGEPCQVLDLSHSKTGKHGHAKIRMEVIGLFDKKKRSPVMPSTAKVQVPIIDKRNAQVISLEGEEMSVMDNETYETLSIPKPTDPNHLAKLHEIIDAGKTAEVEYWIVMNRFLVNRIKEMDI